LKKYAFTMIELVFVLVVIGIITAVILPRIDRDNVYEATQQLESHIKYAQHLAMIDNVYDDSSSSWFRNRWGVFFDTVVTRYILKHSTDGGATWVNAIDPLTKVAFSDTDDSSTDLNSKFDILTITASSNCANNKVLIFDTLGRPYIFPSDAQVTVAANPQTGLLGADCLITLASSEHNATITIESETGYTSITSFN